MVSVILPVYNCAEYVHLAIESILTQSLTDLELIVINDGSTDQTAEVVNSFTDSRMTYIGNPVNLGLSRTRNVGIKAARGRFIALMDADDIALPSRLALQVQYLEANPQVAVVGGAILNIDEHGKPFGQIQRYPSESDLLKSRLETGYPFANPTLMFERDALLASGGYRSAFDYAEDYDLMLRISERHNLANIPDCVLQYRNHKASATNKNALKCEIAIRAAKESSRCRKKGLQDPCEGAETLTPELLAQLGLSAVELDDIKANSYRVRALRMLRSKDVVTARSVLNHYFSDPLEPNARHSISPEMKIVHFRILIGEARPLSAAAHLLTRCLFDGRALKLICGKLWRAVRPR